jgi:hypothetical protein
MAKVMVACGTLTATDVLPIEMVVELIRTNPPTCGKPRRRQPARTGACQVTSLRAALDTLSASEWTPDGSARQNSVQPVVDHLVVSA